MPPPESSRVLREWLLRQSGVLRFLLGLLVCHASLVHLTSEGVSKEYELKAVLLWRLAQYVDFPSEVFSSPEAPMVIGVLGENPFGGALALAAQDETAHGRKITVRYYRDLSEIRECHVLFIAASERARVRAIINGLHERSILTVSDLEEFARYDDGMVRFALEQGKITLVVNLAAVTSANLKIDGRLLRMAQIVKPK